jgi:predicted nucleic acid-binding protein
VRNVGKSTIDSSCVIALDHLDLVPKLASLFGVVLVPRAVQIELYRKNTTRHRIKKLLENYAFFQKCDTYDQVALDVLLAERKSTKDRGEAEAVVQASELGASILIDDAWGRKLAMRSQLEVQGTVGVLNKFREMELISGEELRQGFVALKRKRIRLPWTTVDQVLVDWGEEKLSS